MSFLKEPLYSYIPAITKINYNIYKISLNLIDVIQMKINIILLAAILKSDTTPTIGQISDGPITKNVTEKIS